MTNEIEHYKVSANGHYRVGDAATPAGRAFFKRVCCCLISDSATYIQVPTVAFRFNISYVTKVTLFIIESSQLFQVSRSCELSGRLSVIPIIAVSK